MYAEALSGGTGLFAFTGTSVAGDFLRDDGSASGAILQARFGVNIRLKVMGDGNVFADGDFTGSGADFAESIEPLGEKEAYEPGDVLVIDSTGQRRVALASTPYSTRVAGIYSTTPGLLGRQWEDENPRLAEEIPMAIVGIVPCKVSAENGPIAVGDLLVTSSTAGHAMKGTNRKRMLGAVVGKALEHLPKAKGVILALVTLQ